MSTTSNDEDFIEDNDDEFNQILSNEKKGLLLANRRSRVSTMAFHDWFVKTYKRDYKQADSTIAEAYLAGAADEVENNEYIFEDSKLKLDYHKNKSMKLSDRVQVLYGLLDLVARKTDAPEQLKKMIKKALAEQD